MTAMTAHLPLLYLVDDDEAYVSILARQLAKHQFDVQTALNVNDCLLLCQKQQPNFMLLDLHIEAESGLKLIEPILKLCPNCQIVVVTGYASIPTAVLALKLGAVDFLTKPVHVSDIVAALNGYDDKTTDLVEVDDERMSVQRMEWEYIQQALNAHNGNISATAKALKMHRRTLQRKLAKKCPHSSEDSE